MIGQPNQANLQLQSEFTIAHMKNSPEQKMLKRSFTLITVAGLGASVAFAAFAGFPTKPVKADTTVGATQDDGEEENEEDEGKAVALADVPAGAKAAIEKAAGKNEVTGVKSEDAFGVTVYEAAWNVGEMVHEVVVSADGTVLEMEEVVATTDAPQAVQDAVAKQFPKGSTVEVEKKTMVFYSAEAMIGDEEKEILLTGTGQMVEVEADEDHEDEDHEHEDHDHEDEEN